MELKTGYKHTEVGVLPEDWEVKSLKDLGHFKNGINKSAEDFGHGYPFVNLLDVFGKSKLPSETDGLGLVNSSDIDRRTYDLKRGDVLFVRSSVKPEGVGLTALVQSNLPDAVFSGFLLRFRSSGQLTAEYTEHCFYQHKFRRNLIACSSVSANTNVSQTALNKLGIWFPPNELEQTAIATALSDVDAFLAAQDALIAKQRAIKQGTMQKLLTGKRRLPGFSGEWEAKSLGEVAEVKTGPFGSSLHERDYVSDGTPIITVEHLGERGVDHFNLPMVSDADRRRLDVYSLAAGDIVFSRVGSIDRNALIREPEVGWLFSGRLLRVRLLRNTVDAMFLSYQFHSERFKLAVRNMAVGQTMASLNTKILSGLIVFLPPAKEQTAIAQILSDMDTKIAAMESKRDKTALVKCAMMQELLTGKTRLV